MTTIYLAGPINGCTDAEALDWREELTTLLRGHQVISPMARDYRGKENENVEDIVEGDKADIRKSQVVVAYCPRPSVGTSMEVLYARERGLQVAVLTPEGVSVSPWLRYHADCVASDMGSVVEFIAAVSSASQVGVRAVK